MSWERTQKHGRSLPSTTLNSMLSASSPISAPPSLTTSPWLGRRNRRDDWEGSFNSRPSHGSSVHKLQATREDKDGSLQCLCYQHIAEWQRDMDYICLAGEKAQLIPPEKHPSYLENILAVQSNQR